MRQETHHSLPFATPPRSNLWTLGGIETHAINNGYDFEIEARLHSAAEWTADCGRAETYRSRFGLDERQMKTLISFFRDRNREAWGPHTAVD